MTARLPFHLSSRQIAAFGGTWLVAVGIGFVLLAGHSNRPAESAVPSSHWPQHSQIDLSQTGATLVMFAHPYCPCTKASLGELEKLLARAGGAVTPWIVVLETQVTSSARQSIELQQLTAAIPGVRVLADADGAEAIRFQAMSSGETFLYDANGTLLFSGGITFARGHFGDNLGRSAIETLLSGGSPSCSQTPTFGCPLAEATPITKVP